MGQYIFSPIDPGHLIAKTKDSKKYNVKGNNHNGLINANGNDKIYNVKNAGMKCLSFASEPTFFKTNGLNNPYWKYCLNNPLILERG